MALAAASWSQIDLTHPVATVNGESIDATDYYHRMEFLAGVGRRIGNSYVEFPPGFMTLEQLITEHLILQLAKDKGVMPTGLEVQDELKHRLEANPKFIDNWLASGKTREDLDHKVLVDLAQFNIQTAGITITDQEVNNYYVQNPNSFTVPKRYKLRTIAVTSDAAKAAVDKDLAAGRPFGEVAKERSEDVTKAVNGEFATLPVNLIPEGPRPMILATKIGDSTPWIEAKPGTWAKFYVEAIYKEETEPLTDDLKRSIRRTLMLQRGQLKNDIEKEMAEMRSKAKIDISNKAFADAYAKFVNAYLKDQTPPKQN